MAQSSQSSSEEYTWLIEDATTINNIKCAIKDDCFESEVFNIHGFRWYMWLRKDSTQYPGEAGLHLEMVELPTDLTNVTIIRQIIIPELSIDYANTATYSKDLMNWTWPKNTLLSDDVCNFKKLTIKCKMELLHVLDSNGNDITTHWDKPEASTSPFGRKLEGLSKTVSGLQGNLEQIKKSLHVLQATLYRQPKTNEYSDMSKSMNLLTTDIRILMENHVTLTEDQRDVKTWLDKLVKLPQYFCIFCDNGFDSLDVIKLITLQQIKQMKIKKMGHQMKLLNEINKLREDDVEVYMNETTDHSYYDTADQF